jgi:non-ribosomal peptide synthetase component F
VLCSGEALPPDLVERFFARQDAGTTLRDRAAVDITRWACQRPTRRTVPISRPVANTRAHVLDAFRRPLPIASPANCTWQSR